MINRPTQPLIQGTSMLRKVSNLVLLAEEETAVLECSKRMLLLVTEPTSATLGGSAVWDCLTFKSGFDPSDQASKTFALSHKIYFKV
ncbi:hypothetical protein DY000_02011213 [Brassica cretica]|nr:hypothetical protein DY000_02011213 [Brassica cretica]